MPWFIYILLCEGDKLYTGVARDVQARFALHQAGKGAKYTRGRKPIKIVHIEEYPDRSTAQIREAQIKKMKRQQKDWLIISTTEGRLPW